MERGILDPAPSDVHGRQSTARRGTGRGRASGESHNLHKPNNCAIGGKPQRPSPENTTLESDKKSQFVHWRPWDGPRAAQYRPRRPREARGCYLPVIFPAKVAAPAFPTPVPSQASVTLLPLWEPPVADFGHVSHPLVTVLGDYKYLYSIYLHVCIHTCVTSRMHLHTCAPARFYKEGPPPLPCTLPSTTPRDSDTLARIDTTHTPSTTCVRLVLSRACDTPHFQPLRAEKVSQAL